jgi:nitrite reductase (NADH) small subunit
MTSDLLDDQSREIFIEGLVIAVFRNAGKLYAMDGMCMHQGGPIARGKVESGCVTCPWHGWQYELNSGNNAATGKPMLSTYPIRDHEGWIEIEIPTQSCI